MGLIYVFFIIAILLLIMLAFNSIMRNYLKVEKPKLLSYNHVNKKHKKIDFTIRIIFTIIVLITFIYVSINSDIHKNFFGFALVIFFTIFFIATETTRAFMEWKYADNPKAYIFTISQLIFSLVFLWIISFSIFFNLV